MVSDAWHIYIICMLGTVCNHKLYAYELCKKKKSCFLQIILRVLSSKDIYEITWSNLNENIEKAILYCSDV